MKEAQRSHDRRPIRCFHEFAEEFDRIKALCGRIVTSNLHLPVSERVKAVRGALSNLTQAFKGQKNTIQEMSESGTRSYGMSLIL